MKTPICIVAILISCFVTGCDKIIASRPADDFQLVTTPAGDSYIFHPKTGKIVRVTREGLDTLGETTKVLQVGEYYKLGDGGDQPFVKYLGGGKFAPSKWAIKKEPQ